jgi:hypothetical protein
LWPCFVREKTKHDGVSRKFRTFLDLFGLSQLEPERMSDAAARRRAERVESELERGESRASSVRRNSARSELELGRALGDAPVAGERRANGVRPDARGVRAQRRKRDPKRLTARSPIGEITPKRAPTPKAARGLGALGDHRKFRLKL